MPQTTIESSSRPGSTAQVQPAFDFLDLKMQFAGIRDEVMAAVTRVLESQQFILGPSSTFRAGICHKIQRGAHRWLRLGYRRSNSGPYGGWSRPRRRGHQLSV